MNDNLETRAQALISALIDQDADAVTRHQAWLMGECAAGLLHQDGEALSALRAAVADLGPVADHYGEGKAGERWRAVWELLYAIGETSRPLEQLRLARADTLAGRLLRLIRDEPGISPGEMAKRVHKRSNHVSNALRALIGQGLVHRVPQGRELRYYLSATAREALLDDAPVEQPEPRAPAPAAASAAADSSPAGNLLHFRPKRMDRARDPRIVPGARGRGRVSRQ